MAPDKAQALEYFDHLHSSYAAYHDHKENTAWAALALYMVVVIQLAGTLGASTDHIEKAGRAGVLIIVGIVLNGFIGTQLKLCRTGSQYASAALALYTEYLTKEPDQMLEGDFKINQPGQSEYQSSFTIADIVEKKRKDFEKLGGKNRLLLENTVLFMVALIGAMGVLVILLR